jgi:hypothetical protein
VDGSDVLPSLFEERNHVIDGHIDIMSKFFSIELDSSALIIRIPDGAAQANALLELELNRILELLNLSDNFLTLVHRYGELTHLDKNISE